MRNVSRTVTVAAAASSGWDASVRQAQPTSSRSARYASGGRSATPAAVLIVGLVV